MKLGIIGLVGSGKTTLFNSLYKANINENLGSKKRPNLKIVPVPDLRLNKLKEIFDPKKTTPAYIEFVDITGLGHNDNPKGNQFLNGIRDVDALIHVVRCFEYGSSNNNDSSLNPLKDIEKVDMELLVSDLESIEKRIDSINKQLRNPNPLLKNELEILLKIKSGLENDISARNIVLSDNDKKIIRSMGLLTLKPIIYCANISEDYLNEEKNDIAKEVESYALKEKSEFISICAKVEEEISYLEENDKEAFMCEMKIEESALDKLISSSYNALGLISFLTAGPDEVRAWTIRKGQKAPEAAGKIHSDIKRGFIRAETIEFDRFIEVGAFSKAKEIGILRSEGKDYTVKDGDIIDFKFNV